MEDVIKIVKYLEDSGFLLKGVSEAIQNEAKEQKWGFLSMLLGALGAILWSNIYQVKEWIDQEKDLWELVMDLQSKRRIFNTTSSFM